MLGGEFWMLPTTYACQSNVKRQLDTLYGYIFVLQKSLFLILIFTSFTGSIKLLILYPVFGLVMTIVFIPEL
jgi:hypothetical protein